MFEEQKARIERIKREKERDGRMFRSRNDIALHCHCVEAGTHEGVRAEQRRIIAEAYASGDIKDFRKKQSLASRFRVWCRCGH